MLVIRFRQKSFMLKKTILKRLRLGRKRPWYIIGCFHLYLFMIKNEEFRRKGIAKEIIAQFTLFQILSKFLVLVSELPVKRNYK